MFSDPNSMKQAVKVFVSRRPEVRRSLWDKTCGTARWASTLHPVYEDSAEQHRRLVSMHCRRGNVEDAKAVFEKMVDKDSVSSTLLMATLGREGHTNDAVKLLHQTLNEGVSYDLVSLITALDACCIGRRSLRIGELIHSFILERRQDLNAVAGTALLKMYVKCGNLVRAKQVFWEITQRDSVAWTTMLAAYAENGHIVEAINAFYQMQAEGIRPNSYTVVAVLQACATFDAKVEQAQVLCKQIVESGLISDTWNVIVATALIGIYGKCGNVEDALAVFENIPTRHRDAAAWNSIITVCVEHGKATVGLELLRKMQLEGVKPTKITFLKALAAATEAGNISMGLVLHVEAAQRFVDRDVVIGTAIASMYNRFGRVDDSVRALDRIQQQGRDLICWNMIISALAQHCRSTEAFSYFRRMNLEGIKPDRGTFASLLSSSSGTIPENEVEMILSQVSQSGLSSDLIVSNSVLNMHAKHRRLVDARKTFDSIPEPDNFTWNTILAAYVAEGYGEEATLLFHKMQQEGRRPDIVTVTIMFSAYTEHRGFEDAYQAILCNIELQPEVVCSLLIVGFAQQGLFKQALRVFRHMQLQGLRLENVSLIPIINSCAACAALEDGKMIHSELQRRGEPTFSEDSQVKNALIDMYGKCGKVELAYQTFCQIQQPTVISWTAIVVAFGQNGYVEEAEHLFRVMTLHGASPDSITFTSILSMCSHAGLLEDGCQYFGSLSSDHFLRPTPEHYSCVIDLLGRVGWLEEAENFIGGLSCALDVFVWTTLLSACRSHGDVERGKRIARKVMQLEPECSTGYIGLANIMSA